MAAKKPSIVRGIAVDRIGILYRLAMEEYSHSPKLSKRYIMLIGKISRHYKIRVRKEIKNHICKKCGAPLIPGQNLSVRIVSSRRQLVYRCTECNTEKRIPY